jgi:hypothetical protein
MSAYVSVIIALVGLVVYILTGGKASELGRLSFFAGLLAFLMGVARESVHLFK